MIVRMLRNPVLAVSKPQVPTLPFKTLSLSLPLIFLPIFLLSTLFSFRCLLFRFKSFLDLMDDLSTKKCVPCNSKDLRSMTEESASKLIPKVDGWILVNEGGILKLKRSWKVKSFTKGLELFQLIADIAEAEGHHPDLHLVGWNNVTVEIWTHAVGGLTENDFILAAKINVLDLHHLLRKKVTP
ncbi:hypothetical protein DITRI_Ditri19aG0061100 [Diplodiscus trichospermus]